jgi:cystathionine beta-lyase/cystathionine gamma-synthase
VDFETRAIHAGQEPDPHTGAVTVPIYATSTYAQKAVGEFRYDYSRTANPTREAFEAWRRWREPSTAPRSGPGWPPPRR